MVCSVFFVNKTGRTLCILSQYVSPVVKNNLSLINRSLCVRHIAPIFNENGHFLHSSLLEKAVKLTYWKFRELQKNVSCFFGQVPAVCLHGQMQSAF